MKQLLQYQVLNLYAGIGGNRKLWPEHCQVTAIEKDPAIAEAYAELYPQDTVIVDDAHMYLLDLHQYFDFVWSSPPCQTHSMMNKATRHEIFRYPDLRLYEEIIFLSHFFKGKFVVENVAPYYQLYCHDAPTVQIGRHRFWANFAIPPVRIPTREGNIAEIQDSDALDELKAWLGIDAGNIYPNNSNGEKVKDPAQVYRNCVHPDVGLAILNAAMGEPIQTDIEDLFSRGRHA